MKDHGITERTPMVRALLDGRKTQTRRQVNMSDVGFIGGREDDRDDPGLWGFADQHGCWHVLDQSKPAWTGRGVPHESYRIEAPHGPVGRRLWVRETWHHCPHCEFSTAYRAGGWMVDANDHNDTDERPLNPKCAAHGWRPPLHMPRYVSRITLEVTSVRLERVQQITEKDAKAEGVDAEADPDDVIHEGADSGMGHGYASPRSYTASYAKLWDASYGAGSWAASPWVWVYEFRRVA